MQTKYGQIVIWSVLILLISIGLLYKRFDGLGQQKVEAQSANSDVQWQEVTENRSCPNSTCPAGAGFTVDREGQFTTGRGTEGMLTEEELTQLDQLAQAVAIQDLSADPLCDAVSAEEGTVVTLTLDEELIVYEGQEDDTLCHLGNLDTVLALKEDLDQLAAKYDQVQAAPAPVVSCNDLKDQMDQRIFSLVPQESERCETDEDCSPLGFVLSGIRNGEPTACTASCEPALTNSQVEAAIATLDADARLDQLCGQFLNQGCPASGVPGCGQVTCQNNVCVFGEPSPSPSPSPSPTATSPSPSPTPTPTDTMSPTPTASPTQTVTATPLANAYGE